MRRTATLGGVLAIMLGGMALPSPAAVTIYTDKAQWQAAVGGQFETESFAGSQLNAGVSFTSSESGHINPAGEYYQDVLASTSQSEPMTVWNFAPDIRAFGGKWTLGGPGGSGNSLLVSAGDPAVHIGTISNSYDGEFWGFVADVPFGSVTLVGGSGSNQQNYKLDDMVYSAVPEPGALVLLVTSAAWLLTARYRPRHRS